MKDFKLNIKFYFIILVSFSVVPLLTHFIFFKQQQLIRALFYVGSAGGIGGILATIKCYLKQFSIDSNKYRDIFWYLVIPLQGIIIGVFTYFLAFPIYLYLTFQTINHYNTSLAFFCAISFIISYLIMPPIEIKNKE